MNTPLHDAISKQSPTLDLKAGDLVISMVRIEPGDFMMGSPAEEVGRQANEPAHPVRLTQPFYLAKYQVTQSQFQTVMGFNPAKVKKDSLVVDQVLLAEAQEFCKRVARAVGASVVLPTETQWEYACRAGTTTPNYAGKSDKDLDRVAWYRENSGGHVHAPGEKEPNAWGLHDMLGNVWELCSDFIKTPDSKAAIDPVGVQAESVAAMRGGGWMNGPEDCRAARRSVSIDTFGGAGIRLLLQP